MITIKDIEKFFCDHPEFWEEKYPVLGRADQLKDRNGVISSSGIRFIFDDNEKMIRLFIEDIQKREKESQKSLDDFIIKGFKKK